MIKRQNTENIIGIDAFRGLAIILMFITHGSRLYNQTDNSLFLKSILDFFLLIEPFTSASFLFLVGVGVNLSFNNKKTNYKSWLYNNLYKSGLLYIIGIIFFFAEYGFQPYEIFLSPSILSIISLSIILLSLSVLYQPLIYLNTFIIFCISYYFEGVATSGINTGPGGLFPIIIFSFLGYISYDFFKNKNKLGLLGLFIGIISWFFPNSPNENWINHYVSNYDHFISGQTGVDYIQSLAKVDGYSSNSFWNHSLLSVLRLLIPLNIGLFISIMLKKPSLVINQLAMLGKHSLGLYLLHLIIIAILDFSNLKPDNVFLTWALILGLIIIGLAYANIKEIMTARKAKGA